MNQPPQSIPDFRLRAPAAAALRLALLALAIAFLVLSCLSLWGGQEVRRHFFYAYLVSFSFYLTITLGALFFVMLHHLTGARWSIVLRRLAEGLMMNLTLMLILFIPILFWIPGIYEWADARVVSGSEVLRHKAVFLNPTFFTIRAFIYFAVWLGLAGLLYRRSLRQDETGSPDLIESMRRWSAPGMLLFALTLTFASFDWLMSLDPYWYSTIFGVYVFSGAVMAILATLILLALFLSGLGAMGPAITIEHYHDLGKLLFAFIIFWAYIAFSQFMLIWMGNIPEETVWYLDRWKAPGWRAVSWFLLFGQFILPFLFLLPRATKRNRVTLALAALWILFAHYVDLYWLIMPALDKGRVPVRPVDLYLFLGMGFLFLAYYFWRLRARPLAPLRDPHLAESIAFENV